MFVSFICFYPNQRRVQKLALGGVLGVTFFNYKLKALKDATTEYVLLEDDT